jgi:anti-sigma factor RsiW
MQCQESKKILDAYVDNEVDVLQSVALQEHISGCEDCARAVQGKRALKSAIHNAGLRYTAPLDLTKDVRKALQLPQEKTSSSRWQWFKPAAWGFATAIAACAVVALIALYWLHNQEQSRMYAQVADNYIRSMIMENHGIDVPTSDTHQIKPWFEGKVSFSPPVVDYTSKGFPLMGARLDYLNNERVAALVYKRNQHVINVFIYPATERSGMKASEQRGYNIVRWAKDGMQYWVVSDLNLTELKQFAEMLN